MNEVELKQRQLELLRHKQKLREELPHLHGLPWYQWAHDFFKSTNRMCFLTAGNQLSKAHPPAQIIMTPQGAKRFGDLGVGDYVFSGKGKPCRVVDIPYRGEAECFEVVFNDKSSTIVSEHHEWVAKGPEERFRKTHTVGRGKRKGEVFANPDYGKWKIFETREIIKQGRYSPGAPRPKCRFSIPAPPVVQYPKKNLFDPYYLGIYLGNGGEHSISFHDEDLDLKVYCMKYGSAYNADRVVVGVLQPTKSILDGLGVRKPSDQKFIPKEYLVSSEQQRKDLLAGLMDTDGTVDKTGKVVSYSTTSKQLAQDIVELVCSLGGMAYFTQREAGYKSEGSFIRCRDVYNVRIWLEFNPFRSKRKAARWRPNIRYKHERVIEEIRPLGKMPCRCITVDSSDGTYLIEPSYIVTHNSSSQIRKIIYWATEKRLWESLWPNSASEPNVFWYFYPTLDVATEEFDLKWKQFLPAGAMKDHPVFGWKMDKKNNRVYALKFNSGVTVFFKSYKQDEEDLQTGTIFYVAADEEMPMHLWPEIQARLNASDGYFSMVFTATIGQEFWRKVIEGKKDEELLPEADKWQISIFDCLHYMDGSPSPWTFDKVKRALLRMTQIPENAARIQNAFSFEELYKSVADMPEPEIQRRAFGRFIFAGGLKFAAFRRERNTCAAHAIPKHWHIFSGVDYGSGGETNHPAAFVFVAVSPDYKMGRVFLGRRMDGIVTTAQDVLEAYVQKKQEHQVTPVLQTYDWSSKDFHTFATRRGESFIKAEKDQEWGVGTLNTLFRTGVLKIFEGDPELEKLITEITSLKATTLKRDAADDFVDALRYAVMAVPWDWSVLDEMKYDEEAGKKEIPPAPPRSEVELRREFYLGKTEVEDTDKELEEWNDLLHDDIDLY